ncbi:MAG: RNA methyltransferase [Lewinella sp.]|nr:RNA methyltransferase [Lewinella sp.]
MHQKKFRQKYNKFIAEGDKIIREMLAQDRYPIRELYALPAWLAAHEREVANRPFDPQVINEKELAQISQLRTPNQVLVIADIPPAPAIDYARGWGLFLDGIQDPGNLGTILRIADWFAMDYVVAGPGTVELFNSKVIQATMGAFLRVPLIEATLDDILAEEPGLPVLATAMEGESVFTTSLPDHGLLLIGNEGQGLQPAYLTRATQTISIPRAQGGGAESLNAGVATGILCAQLRFNGSTVRPFNS